MFKKRKRQADSDTDVDLTREKSIRKKTHRRVAALPRTSHTTGDLQHAVLSCYFSHVVTLRTFLLSKASFSKQKRLAKVDLACGMVSEKDKLLDETIVGIGKETSVLLEKTREQDFIKFTQDPLRSSMKCSEGTLEQQLDDVVDFVIWSLFFKTPNTSYRPKHILCHGYQSAISLPTMGINPAAPSNIQGLILEHQNHNVQVLKRTPWTNILALLGKDGYCIMRHLLLDCAVFLRLSKGKDNYYQLSGIPVSDMTPTKKYHEQADSKQAPKKRVTPNNIAFARHGILYAKPSSNSRGDVRFSLKPNHVLNKHSEANALEQITHLMRCVFPGQFGLQNVFTSGGEVGSSLQDSKDHALRKTGSNLLAKSSTTVASGQTRLKSLPKRLRGAAQDLVRKLLRNHKRCPYAQLLRYYTSSAAAGLPRIDRITPVQSEKTSSKIQMHSSVASNAMTITSSTREAAQASQESIMQHATPTAQVSAFVEAVLKHLLPCDFLGTGLEGSSNRDVLMQWVNHFVTMGRNESLNLHVVLQNIKISAISWLEPPKLADLKMAAADRDKRWEILDEFVYFVFDSLLLPLIRAHFYVTESAVHRNRLFYFRHDIWRKISEPSLAQLKMTMFEEVALERTLQKSNLGHSTIRLLPKLKGIRIIANLKKKILKKRKGKMVLSSGINKQLEPVFDVLNYERSQQLSRLGSSIFSSNEVHGRLKEFKMQVDRQKLYFVKLDIKSCFDSIPQEELAKLARTLFQDSRYRIHTHAEIKGGDEKISRRYPRKASAVRDNIVFPISKAMELALERKRTIFSGTGNLRTQRTPALLNMLHEHIMSNTVKLGSKLYRQKNGIPQGSILSSLLCSFFYGAFEAEHLSFLDERSLLVRLIDDFLLVTADLAAAKRFLDVMSSGNLKYGITVQAAKSLTNFDASVNGRKIPRLHGTTTFPYIGLSIDTLTLSVAKERASKDPEVRNGLTVQLQQAGQAFRVKVLHSLKIQLLAIVLDTQLSSKVKVLTNLFQCFAEMAMKMCRYVDDMATKPSAGLVVRVLEESMFLAFNLMRQQSRVREKIGYKCDISKTQLKWVAATAVEAVLKRKQSRFAEVLAWTVNTKRSTEAGIKIDQRMQKLVVDEGSRDFQGYRF